MRNWVFKYFILSLTLLLFSKLLCAQNGKISLPTPNEIDKNKSATYFEAISYYETLEKTFPIIDIRSYGQTDADKPLHVVFISKEKLPEAQLPKEKKKPILLILNAIHPGEPEGVDASLAFARDVALKPEMRKWIDSIIIAIIPIYNIEGALQRGCCSRVNQNGPDEYGFRANGKNLDLNRDFLKADSRNAKTFSAIFQQLNPEILIDNHTSNGADYVYTLTYLDNHYYLSKNLQNHSEGKILPTIKNKAMKNGFELYPYVDLVDKIPDSGIAKEYYSGRFSLGYAGLFNTLSYTVETHMLKPFPERVKATYSFLYGVAEALWQNSSLVLTTKDKANKELINNKSITLSWSVNKSKSEDILFKGYTAQFISSKVTGAHRLKYDRSHPFTKKIRYYNSLSPDLVLTKPKGYIIPKAWEGVIERLKMNQVALFKIHKPTEYFIEEYTIESYQTNTNNPIEGHYPHNKIKVSTKATKRTIESGDYFVPSNQERIAYIMQVLEPQSEESFFAWNFFDGILQQKEYYSDYVFEDKALELLEQDKELATRFEQKKQSDTTFDKNPKLQLNFIHQNSKFFEPVYKKYPILRIIE